jgi:hypothetical protein
MSAIDQFRANVAIVRDLIGLAQSIDAITAGALKLDDIHRSVLAMAVSALDHYVHEKAIEGMIEVAAGRRPATDAYKKFPIRLDSVNSALAAPATLAWLALEIRTANGYRTFQKADDIADALRTCSSVPLWPGVANIVGSGPAHVKRRLDLIVDRRNKKVHEFDVEPTGLGNRWLISEHTATDSLNFIVQVGEAIHVITQ